MTKVTCVVNIIENSLKPHHRNSSSTRSRKVPVLRSRASAAFLTEIKSFSMLFVIAYI